MRKIIGIILCAVLSIYNVHAQWKIYYEFPESGFIMDIEIVNNQIIYIGRNHQINKSINFGNTWTIVLDTSEIDGGYFQDIEFLNETHGYSAKRGYDTPGICYATENGGSSWEAVIPAIGDYSPVTNNVCIAAPGHIYLTAGEGVYDGKVFYTHDNFVHLESVRPAPLNFFQQVADIDCISADTCIAIHGTPYCCDGGTEKGMYKTVNGGVDWELLRYLNEGIDIEFTSRNVLYAFNTQYLIKSVDQGETWDSLKKNVFGGYFKTMKFLNDSVGYLTEWMYPENKIYFTQDGGETWIENTIDSMPAGPIDAIDCLNADSCFFGSSRKLYRNFGNDTISNLSNENTTDIFFDIIPNPAIDILHLNLSIKEKNFIIRTFNIVGELTALPFQNNQASVSHLPPGIYFTEVISEYGKAVLKWVKM